MKPSPGNKIIVVLVLTFFIFLVFVISGFTVIRFDPPVDSVPADATPASFRLTNVIKNGDFEDFPTGILPGSQVANHWLPADNGGAHFGWYDEQWEEAIHTGDHSQLMEIYLVDGQQYDRSMAIYQTVNVVPNMNYLLTIHSMMRSDAPHPLRNMEDYAMHYGIDYEGREKYYHVTNWVEMPITEQIRIGSNGPVDDNTHLYFERITSTIFTGNSTKLTLFIRGMKIKPTGTELNFNIDDVSLLGPFFPPTATPIPTPTYTRRPTSTPTTTSTPAELPVTGDEEQAVQAKYNSSQAHDRSLPDAGGILPKGLSVSTVIFSSLVFVVLGVAAASGLLWHRKK